MRYWLIKSEPADYSFSDLLREGRAIWDGIRNAQARRYLAQMEAGDKLFYYHAAPERAIVGLAEVVRSAFPDPADPRWLAVEIRPLHPFSQPVSLSFLKKDARFVEFALVRQPRLSVMPVPPLLTDILLRWGQLGPG